MSLNVLNIPKSPNFWQLVLLAGTYSAKYFGGLGLRIFDSEPRKIPGGWPRFTHQSSRNFVINRLVYIILGFGGFFGENREKPRNNRLVQNSGNFLYSREITPKFNFLNISTRTNIWWSKILKFGQFSGPPLRQQQWVPTPILLLRPSSDPQLPF